MIDFLHLLVDRCVELLDVDAAGLLPADQHGRLQLVASSNEQVRLLELFQLQNDEGPCLDAFATSKRVSDPDLTTAGGRWPRFAAAATQNGFAALRGHARSHNVKLSALALSVVNGDIIPHELLRTSTKPGGPPQ